MTARQHRNRRPPRAAVARHDGVPDRLAADVPAGAEVATVIVDAPREYDSPHTRREYISVRRRGRAQIAGGGNRQRMYRQLRDDPLARLHSHRQIDDAQYQAGRRYQGDFEASQISVAAVDPTREPVDGGRIAEPFGERRMRALKSLARADAALGLRGAILMRYFLLERMPIRAIAAAHAITKRTHVEHLGWEIARHLDTLALHYGYVARSSRRSRKR
jgi:hypothetical protein